jgi:apolipoprotein N-acyltransferase
MKIITPDSIWLRMLQCFLYGGIGALSMPPFTTPALIVSLSLYWITLTSFEKKWHAFPAGFLFGFGYFLAGVWWVGNALLVGGNPYLWALPLAVCGLQALLALFPMMAAVCSQYLHQGRSLGAYLFFLAMMGFWEWARGTFFTGFPWNLFGMAWTYNLAMLQILSVGGIYLLSLLTVFMFSVPAFALAGAAKRSVRFGLLGVAVISGASLFWWGHARLEAQTTEYNPDVIVQVVTPNIPQDEKWDDSLFWPNFVKTIQAIAPARMDGSVTGKTRFIVLPETAMHFSALEDKDAAAELKRILKMYPEKTYLLTGMLRRSFDPTTGEASYHNSLVGLDQDLNENFAFDKFHLVPFGEYIPFQKYIPIGPVVAFSGFNSGPGPQTISLDTAPSFSPLVCYEVIFPGAVTALPRPDWIVNVTNDAWYGRSPGPYQHLGHAVYRAIEEGLPVVRSTNTGISAIIDPYGRILMQSPLFEQAVQTAHLPRPGEKTYFSEHKNIFFFILIIILGLPCIYVSISKFLQRIV